MEAFATSPYGLGIPKSEFWHLSHREYAAREDVWRHSRERAQWAEVMAMLYNINRGNQPSKTASDWMPDVQRDQRNDRMPWEVVDVEQQKINIWQALNFAAAFNAGRGLKE